MADEGGLREALRVGWRGPGEIIWCEHARGGTVGAPDAFVPLGRRRGYLPLELKWWEVGVGEFAGEVQFTARPAQKRFHLLAHEAKQRTAFLGRLSTGDDLALLPGFAIPRDSGSVEQGAALHWMRLLPGIEALRDALLDEAFWKGRAR